MERRGCVKNKLRVAAVQMNPGNVVSENLIHALACVHDAAQCGAELIVLPELFLYRGSVKQ